MHNYGHWKKTLALLVMSALSLGASSVDAMPEGGVVRSGSGSVTQNGKEMTIRQDSGRLAMDWTGFSVGKDETVRFQQPGKDALALNRVTGNQQSVIDGSLLSNGHVLLVNPNGVVIGKNASIDVGGLVASTAQVKDNFMKEFGNSTGAFSLGGVSDGKIINEGTIQAEGGLVAFHAAKVENSGTISNTGGSAVLAAADTLTLTPDADGKLNFTVDGKAAEASALNKGAITADGGTIVMTADSASDVMSTVVNNSGTLQARTLRKNEKGQILLEGGDKGQVEVSGTLDASGMEDGQSAGNIKVIGEKTIVHDGTNLLARGNVDGGKIETSGDVLNLGDNLNIDAKGESGKHGEWLLDPLDVIIAATDPKNATNYNGATPKDASDSDFATSTDSAGKKTSTGSITYNDPTATSANASDVNTAVTWIHKNMVEKMLNAGTNVTIQAAANNGSANIIVRDGITKDDGDDATFTLEAMRNITINGDITSNKNKLNIVLNADTNNDAIGAVIINANLKTNGGYFTSATGGEQIKNADGKIEDNSVKFTGTATAGYSEGTLTGKADPNGHTVGTYFGHVDPSGTADGEKGDRSIQTNGGKITLNGEVAIGLNGGTLTLDSSSADGTKGDITVTGIINSGNSYGAYVYGTDTWNKMTSSLVSNYLDSGKVPAYHYQAVNYKKNEDGTYQYTTEEQDFPSGQIHYTFKETDTENLRWLGNGTVSQTSEPGKGYSSVIVYKGSMNTAEYLAYLAVSAPATFLSRYEVSGATITINDTPRTLTTQTLGNTTYLGYIGPKGGFNRLSSDQIQSVAQNAATLAQDSTNTTVMNNKSTAYANLTDDIELLIANNWFVSKDLAQGSTKGASAVEDSYLATITTVLENSLTTPNGQQILWVGGRGSGVLKKTNDNTNPYSHYGMPADPLYQDGMYWVTGPEGEANKRKGTQFYSNEGSDWGTVSLGSDGKTYTYNQGNNVYGYVNWDTWTDKATATDTKRVDVTRSQPDNSSPFLSVGYGTTGKWDDAAMGGATTVGFIKETNLANSSLNIKAGCGEVKLQGDIGKSKALDTVSIESTNAVTVGTDNNNVTDYYHGTIYVDHGLYISGNGVKVGGEIHSGESEETDTSTTLEDKYKDNVTILSFGDIEVHGITSNTYAANKDGTTTTRGGKISLTSTGDTGKITLGAGVDYNGEATDGTLAAASSEQGAVVIDAQGTKGAFVNETTGDKGIDTAGTWLIYSASPDKDTFKTNLNSETDAEWTAKSDDNANTDNSSGKTMHVYDTKDSTHTTNKYIFQVQPVITVSGTDTTKTYGVEWGTNDLKNLISYSASYVNIDNDSIDVSTGKDQKGNAFTNAFKELGYKNYISNADGTEVGESNISYSSKGAARTADRVTGDKEDANHNKILAKSDDQPAVYNLLVEKKSGTKGLHGYDVTTNDGSIEITKRQVTINQNGTITYGSSQGIAYEAPTSEEATDITGLTNRDTIGSVTMTASKEYQNSKGTRNTGDTGTYDLTTDGTNTHIVNNGKDVSVNYDISGSGKLTVEKATLTLDTGSTTKEYGDAAGVKDFLTDKEKNYTLDGFVNGDENDTDKQKAIRGQIGVTNKSEALKDDSHTSDVLNGGNSGYTIDTVATPNADLKNYNVVVKNGNTVTLKPVDIYIYAEGNGSTLGDVTWTKITRDDLVNGDSWDKGLFAFRVEPGDLISYADKIFGIKGYVNGQLVSDGTQLGNYIYHPAGRVQLTFNPIVKPDVWAHSGGYRPRNKIETSLPIFRVEDAKVGQYGTYGVEHNEEGDRLVLSATGMRLPEPDQVPDEERTFTTTLSTETGSGTFKLVYNGVSLKVYPQDKEAEETVRAGDKTKNVSLSEKALYVGYTEMGLDLIDLKGVYIYFN